MTTARLFSATAAVAAGLALLSSGGGSVAGWYDELEIPGATVSSGELRVEELSTSATTVGTTVVVEATSKLHMDGDALAADLALDVLGLTKLDGSSAHLTVVTDPAGRLNASAVGPWRVDETSDELTVTARITLPVADAKALTGQPRVTWTLEQTAPGQGWYSEAVHDVSLAGLWPSAPVFPELGCTPSSTTDGAITIVWTWSGEEPALWEILEYNGAGNRPAVEKTIAADGSVVYSATVDTQNGNWLYSVRATYENGTTVESPYLTRTCAVENQNGG